MHERLGEGEAEARAFRLDFLRLRIEQPIVERFFGLDPRVIVLEGHDFRVGLRDVDQVAVALHVRLARQHPQVPDEEGACLHVLFTSVDFDRGVDEVRPAGGNAAQLAVDKPIGADRRRKQRDRLERRALELWFEHDGDFAAAFQVALIDAIANGLGEEVRGLLLRVR